ncbi:MAG: hypothetical protein ACI8UP_001856, partial [Porticoccaceae bacterium]
YALWIERYFLLLEFAKRNWESCIATAHHTQKV